MTQSKSRRLLYQQARLIRIQWAVILALVCTIILMAIFLPKAKAVEETAAPTLELEPTSYVTPEIMPEPIIEIEPEETEPVLEELGEFRLTAYCACAKCCGKDPWRLWLWRYRVWRGRRGRPNDCSRFLCYPSWL